MGSQGRRAAVRVRRSPHLVVYWRSKTLVACNYVTGARVEVPPRACELLSFCDEWTRLEVVRRAGFVPEASFAAVIARLFTLTLLERSDRPADPRAVAMEALRPWNPQFGFFHATTKDVRFVAKATVARRARTSGTPPPPPAVKRYRDVPVVNLRPPDGAEPFGRLLRSRRTWRRYSSEPVALDELAVLLGLSAGVQQWVLGGELTIPLKTSPSGGARHAVECYVIARDVRGLRPGVYHYAPDRHALSRIAREVSLTRLKAYVPGSEYFAKASAMVFFTAVFERIAWRYPFARAYRAALIEAGHVCQTFLLTATSLGLAPFSVMALADSVIERDLGIDGISESVLYAAGVGRPPRGATWAPLPKGPNPKILKNRRL